MYFHKDIDQNLFTSEIILHNLSDYITIIDTNYKIIGINLTHDYAKQSVDQKKSIFDYIQPEFHSLVQAKIDEAIRKQQPTDYEIKANKSEDEIIWYATRVSPIIRNHSVEAIILHSNDIIDLKSFEEELFKTKTHLQAMIEAVPDMIVIVNKDGLIKDYKAPTDKNFETPELNRIIGKYLTTILPKDLADQTMQMVKDCLEFNKTTSLEYLNPSLLNQFRSFEARACMIGDNEVLLIVRDTSNMKKMQQEILDVSSRTQRSIGQDLHDSLSQQLTGIAMMTKVLSKKLKDQDSSYFKDADMIVSLVNQCIDQAHNLSRGLHPVELERNGFVAALKELTLLSEKLYQVKIDYTFIADFKIGDLSKATHLYRMVQEAIANATKHGHATEIDITLKNEQNQYTLCIKDNGKGFNPESLTKPGLGLNIMKYRASMIGAKVSVQSRPTQGTIICIQFSE